MFNLPNPSIISIHFSSNDNKETIVYVFIHTDNLLMLKTLYKKITRSILTLLVLIYLLLDELIWERIAEPIYQFIHGLKILQKVEIAIVSLNRYALLILFLSLFVAVELLGVVAIGLFAQGLIVPASILYTGKIPVTAFTFWVFKIAQSKLLTFIWFKYCYESVLSVIHKIKTSSVYLNIKAKTISIKLRIKSIWSSQTVQAVRRFFGFKRSK